MNDQQAGLTHLNFLLVNGIYRAVTVDNLIAWLYAKGQKEIAEELRDIAEKEFAIILERMVADMKKEPVGEIKTQ